MRGNARLLKALQRKHSDMTMEEKLPDAAAVFAKLERKVSKLEKRLRTVEMQSQKAFAKSVTTERMLLTYIERNGGCDAEKAKY